MTPQGDEPITFTVWLIGESETTEEMRGALLNATSTYNSHQTILDTRIHCTTISDNPPEGDVHAIVGTLATTTWTRARHSFQPGPPPLRSAEWPWGFPWLGEADRSTIDAANKETEALIELFHRTAVDSPSTRLLFLHPEDLGIADRGRPASPWQLPNLRALAREKRMHRLAFFQCSFGPFRAAAPTGLLTCSPMRSPHLARGWPSFRGNANADYIGPLGSKCVCSDNHQAWKKTSASLHDARNYNASYNPSFLDWLFSALIKDHLPSVEPLRLGSANTVHSESSEETWSEELPQDFAANDLFDQRDGYDVGDFDDLQDTDMTRERDIKDLQNSLKKHKRKRSSASHTNSKVVTGQPNKSSSNIKRST